MQLAKSLIDGCIYLANEKGSGEPQMRVNSDCMREAATKVCGMHQPA